MQRTSGFTLIELVIVLVILGVLAAVAVPQFSGTADTADRTALRAQAKAISSANAANVANCRLNPDGDGCITGIDSNNVTTISDGGPIDLLMGGDFDTNAYAFETSPTADQTAVDCSPDSDPPNYRFEITNIDDTGTVGDTYYGCLESN